MLYVPLLDSVWWELERDWAGAGTGEEDATLGAGVGAGLVKTGRLLSEAEYWGSGGTGGGGRSGGTFPGRSL